MYCTCTCYCTSLADIYIFVDTFYFRTHNLFSFLFAYLPLFLRLSVVSERRLALNSIAICRLAAAHYFRSTTQLSKPRYTKHISQPEPVHTPRPQSPTRVGLCSVPPDARARNAPFHIQTLHNRLFKTTKHIIHCYLPLNISRPIYA